MSALDGELLLKLKLSSFSVFDCLDPKWIKWIEKIIDIKTKIKKINATRLKSIFKSDFL